MEVSILLLCTYNKTNDVVHLHQALTFAQLVDEICGKFDGLAPKMVLLLFAILGYNKFMVVFYEDVRNMWCLAKSFGLDHIDVLIKKCDLIVGVNNSKGVFTGDSGSRLDSGRMSDFDDRTDLLPSYCPHRSKSFLSARWA
ncbi:hypothetical protein CsSME_00024218 [Camellia sinensis var. sinensis]